MYSKFCSWADADFLPQICTLFVQRGQTVPRRSVMEHYRRWATYSAVFALAVDAYLVLTEYVLT